MKWFLLGRDPPRVRSTDGQSSIVHFTPVIVPLLLFLFALFAVAQEISDTTVSRTGFTATVVNQKKIHPGQFGFRKSPPLTRRLAASRK
jgi:hypothetical protein